MTRPAELTLTDTTLTLTETKPTLFKRTLAKLSPRRLTRAIMVPLLAGALTLTSLSTGPAFAGPKNNNDDINALIAALLGLAVVGAVISNKGDREPRIQDIPRTGRGGGHRGGRSTWDDRQMHPKFQLPRECLRRFKTQHGKQKYWGKRCLKRNYDFARSLPRSCRDTIVAKNNRGVYVTRKVYEPRCLKQAGYRKQRR